jgi:plasmid stability protein
MAEFKVRKLDEQVAASLRARARIHGVSVEEEVRRLLSEAVARKREAFARRAAASRAAPRRRRKRRPSDSTASIRRERDAWG